MSDAPTVKRRPPAYARPLIECRRMGAHPLVVDVLFSRDWGVAKARAAARGDVPVERWVRDHGVPCLALSPSEYVPGAVDWACVTGLMVNLIAAQSFFEDCYLTQDGCYWGPVYSVIGELAQVAAGINLKRRPTDQVMVSADKLAYEYSIGSAGGKRLWPAWWCDEIEARLGKRNSRWYRVAYERFARRDEQRAGA